VVAASDPGVCFLVQRGVCDQVTSSVTVTQAQVRLYSSGNLSPKPLKHSGPFKMLNTNLFGKP